MCLKMNEELFRKKLEAEFKELEQIRQRKRENC